MVTVEAAALSNSDYKIAKSAFADAKKKKWKKASQKAVKAKSALPAKLIRWMQITDPKKDVPFQEIAAFIAHNSDWPRQSVLQRRAEEAMDETIPAGSVLKWFAGRQPVSANGHIMLTAALQQMGRMEELKLQVKKSWLKVNFGRDQQKQFYKRYKKYLSYDDHVQRLDRLLWEGRYYPARRMLGYVKKDWQRLAEARLALRKVRGGVDRAISKVPQKFINHPGLLFERMRWRRIKGRYSGARELLFQAPDQLPFPHVWWKQRAVMARHAVRQGHYSEAYRMVENHGLTKGAKFADAEWLAGWIKLRFLAEPNVALNHFTNLYKAVSFPISKARGAYWIARSLEDLGRDEEANKWYETAATYPTAYYGQLATERLGKRPQLVINTKAEPNRQERIVFQQSELVDVVRLLQRMKERDHMRSFIYQLNTMSTTAGWRTLVAELSIASGRPDLAVYVGKKALREGHGVIEAAYPLVDKTLMRKTPEGALVHGIIRQESAFYEKAKSRAGARGLMQLMPGTAYELAKRKNYKYSRDKLTKNPKLNVWLGSEYLDDLLKKFEGSYVLTLASYNAGPHRARQWIKEFGDPRTDDRDYVIDWVEQIPFDETRNYVQRVLENIQVYRHRLKTTEIASSLEADLKRRK
ncbi:lytic transglycosylase domain-containing protein [Terasakiella sp. A23]|uniref:lytic transglycosylase domain-containing protein n=1 Tax=Terasakiella sp. FCG-A23 TaxID=3080561 RepID=UPI0029546682|nr:lytic transglycosylase domain-containing protein [Terasakiella sp. A23]MDV7341450.1 lytic transglycosylase domain-containing protein [Terasakiella sp. A23]